MPTTQETCAKIVKYYTGKCSQNVSDVKYVKFMELLNFNPQCISSVILGNKGESFQ